MKKTAPLLTLTLLLVCLLTSCGFTVPRPEIKDGKFSFSVTYECNGETNTISGIYVCKYAGTDWALDGGYHRAWSSYFEGGMNEPIEIGVTEDGGTIELRLSFYPEYFMGDPDWSWVGAPEPQLYVSHRNGEELSFQDEAAVIEETYGAKIISYTYDKPIQNAFGLFK